MKKLLFLLIFITGGLKSAALQSELKIDAAGRPSVPPAHAAHAARKAAEDRARKDQARTIARANARLYDFKPSLLNTVLKAVAQIKELFGGAPQAQQLITAYYANPWLYAPIAFSPVAMRSCDNASCNPEMVFARFVPKEDGPLKTQLQVVHREPCLKVLYPEGNLETSSLQGLTQDTAKRAQLKLTRYKSSGWCHVLSLADDRVQAVVKYPDHFDLRFITEPRGQFSAAEKYAMVYWPMLNVAGRACAALVETAAIRKYYWPKPIHTIEELHYTYRSGFNGNSFTTPLFATSSDDNCIAYCADNKLIIMKTAQMTPRELDNQALSFPIQDVITLSFTPCGTMLMVGLRDGSMVALSVESRREVQRFPLAQGAVAQIAFSDDGSLGAAVSIMAADGNAKAQSFVTQWERHTPESLDDLVVMAAIKNITHFADVNHVMEVINKEAESVAEAQKDFAAYKTNNDLLKQKVDDAQKRKASVSLDDMAKIKHNDLREATIKKALARLNSFKQSILQRIKICIDKALRSANSVEQIDIVAGQLLGLDIDESMHKELQDYYQNAANQRMQVLIAPAAQAIVPQPQAQAAQIDQQVNQLQPPAVDPVQQALHIQQLLQPGAQQQPQPVAAPQALQLQAQAQQQVNLQQPQQQTWQSELGKLAVGLGILGAVNYSIVHALNPEIWLDGGIKIKLLILAAGGPASVLVGIDLKRSLKNMAANVNKLETYTLGIADLRSKVAEFAKQSKAGKQLAHIKQQYLVLSECLDATMYQCVKALYQLAKAYCHFLGKFPVKRFNKIRDEFVAQHKDIVSRTKILLAIYRDSFRELLLFMRQIGADCHDSIDQQDVDYYQTCIDLGEKVSLDRVYEIDYEQGLKKLRDVIALRINHKKEATKINQQMQTRLGMLRSKL